MMPIGRVDRPCTSIFRFAPVCFSARYTPPAHRNIQLSSTSLGLFLCASPSGTYTLAYNIQLSNTASGLFLHVSPSYTLAHNNIQLANTSSGLFPCASVWYSVYHYRHLVPCTQHSASNHIFRFIPMCISVWSPRFNTTFSYQKHLLVHSQVTTERQTWQEKVIQRN